MALTNYYPEKPIVPFTKTPVTLPQLTDIIKSVTAEPEVKRMVYVMLRNESANGSKINNNNPGGIQADSGRWDSAWDHAISGVFEIAENGTNKLRYFVAFDTLNNAVAFTCFKVKARGLYIGGFAAKIAKRTIKDAPDLAAAYKQEWVTGNPNATPDAQELSNFLSMYHQAEKLFV